MNDPSVRPNRPKGLLLQTLTSNNDSNWPYLALHNRNLNTMSASHTDPILWWESWSDLLTTICCSRLSRSKLLQSELLRSKLSRSKLLSNSILVTHFCFHLLRIAIEMWRTNHFKSSSNISAAKTRVVDNFNVGVVVVVTSLLSWDDSKRRFYAPHRLTYTLEVMQKMILSFKPK